MCIISCEEVTFCLQLHCCEALNASGEKTHSCCCALRVGFRGLFIIDAKGILRQMTINDLPVGRSVDEVMRLVQAFQFTDKHGEGRQRLFLIYLTEFNMPSDA